ncbi:MAG TPA: type VI secretion system contractile sheath large subunit [Polyangiales bacterium]
MATRLDFSFAPGKGERSRRQRVETDPLRVLVIGDLRGAARPAMEPERPLAHTRITSVGIDNFDALIAQLGPEVVLDAATGEPTRLAFRALADFHPDHLYDSSALIGELRRSRERLLDPRTFPEEKARLLEQAAGPAPSAAPPAETAGSPLERLLGQRPTSAAQTRAGEPESAIDQLLRRIVAPHVTHTPGPEQTRLVASVDTAISEELRRLLHAPAFQRLEAIWRGLFWLVNANAAGEALQLLVLDASRDELLADLRACAGDLTRSRLYQLVVQGETSGPGKQPISLILGDFTCEGSEADVSLLAALGAVAGEAGGAFLAGADPRLVGALDLARAPHQSDWAQPDAAAVQRMALLRESAVAPFIGLAMPRVLGRVPYGKRSDPISRCDFSELGISPSHEHFLWINPGFALAQLVAAAFADESWSFRLGSQLTLTDLPTAIYHDGYNQVLKPCAEAALDYDSAERMQQHGFMALVSHRGEASLQLPRFQSIAQPPAALAGPWR